jgi:beta-amylase
MWIWSGWKTFLVACVLFILGVIIYTIEPTVFVTRVPVFVMMPLDTIDNNGNVRDPNTISKWLAQLKTGGVDGIMIDVWWGIVERKGPRQYDWHGYQQLVSIVKQNDLKMQCVMSFHSCGGNVGDTCNVPLPPWILSIGENNPDIYYTDREGHRDTEYLTWGVDNEPIFQRRTALQIYRDYMRSFASTFSSELGKTIVEIQVGLGPAGELRYPSYQLHLWNFPGVGEFQCYDKYLLADLAKAASAAGHPEWGHGGPNNAGHYSDQPENTEFFSPNTHDNYASSYGQFFLEWYSERLVAHGDRILSAARAIFGNNIRIAAKISGVHWQYKTPSHAAELTAGYKNDQGHGYDIIAQMFQKYNVTFDFTCLEMIDSDQPQQCRCGPQELVVQTKRTAAAVGIPYAGENALEAYSSRSYDQIVTQSRVVRPVVGFTYLRLGPTLLQPNNWATFTNFVNRMHNL